MKAPGDGRSNRSRTQWHSHPARPAGRRQPGIFQSEGTANIVHGNGTQVSDVFPARNGEQLVLFASGLGAVEPPVAAGLPAPFSPVARTVIQPAMFVAGVPAEVRSSGLVPVRWASIKSTSLSLQGSPQGSGRAGDERHPEQFGPAQRRALSGRVPSEYFFPFLFRKRPTLCCLAGTAKNLRAIRLSLYGWGTMKTSQFKNGGQGEKSALERLLPKVFVGRFGGRVLAGSHGAGPGGTGKAATGPGPKFRESAARQLGELEIPLTCQHWPVPFKTRTRKCGWRW